MRDLSHRRVNMGEVLVSGCVPRVIADVGLWANGVPPELQLARPARASLRRTIVSPAYSRRLSGRRRSSDGRVLSVARSRVIFGLRCQASTVAGVGLFGAVTPAAAAMRVAGSAMLRNRSASG